MTKRKAGQLSDAEEARVQAMIARDPDAPEVTDEQAAQARPASEALDTALFSALTVRGRPKSEASKVLVTLRLPPAVIEGYRSGGPGWQVRMGEVLAAGLQMQGGGTPTPQPTGPARLPGGSGVGRSLSERTTRAQRAAKARADREAREAARPKSA